MNDTLAVTGYDAIIGFQDESSPQTTANTERVWSKGKPITIKNTTKIKSNAVGFYPVNGMPVIEFPESSKTKDMCLFLESVRRWNDDRPIIMVIDNFAVHHARAVSSKAEELNIRLVFLPPYSPDLNPIEFVWKSLKKVISRTRIIDREHMTSVLEEQFLTETRKRSYFKSWESKFLY
jgi:transposase